MERKINVINKTDIRWKPRGMLYDSVMIYLKERVTHLFLMSFVNTKCMGRVKFRATPYKGKATIRSKSKIQTIIYGTTFETKSTWTERISACLDPIFNSDYGCFSPKNTKKISCLVNTLPKVLSCIYFGDKGVNYCIPNDSPLKCRGECGFSQIEMERLYGCLNTYGKPPDDCDAFKEDFCDCSVSDKKWNPLKNACECEEGKIDYGKCCSTTICDVERHEQFDCDTKKCECEEGYTRLPYIPTHHPLASYSETCAKECATGSAQNNPINNERGISGCGPAYGKEGDLCCSSNKCVLDNGRWDGRYPNNPTSKSQCLSSYGVWRITDYNTCPRGGHCEYPLCTDPVQILDPFQPDGPAWVFKCERCEAPQSAPSPPQCENACKTFCSSNLAYPNYEKSYCGPVGTSQDTCICHCKD